MAVSHDHTVHGEEACVPPPCTTEADVSCISDSKSWACDFYGGCARELSIVAVCGSDALKHQ